MQTGIYNLHLNGKAYSGTWLDHDELMKGAVIDFEMTDNLKSNEYIKLTDYPYSISGTWNANHWNPCEVKATAMI